MTKRSPRTTRGAVRRPAPARVGGPARLPKLKPPPGRSRGPTGAGGRIGPFGPSAQALVATLPLKGGLGRGERIRRVSLKSGLVPRGNVQVNAADSLPGFRWDVPAPEPNRLLAWAAIWFDWQFWRWYSNWLNNTTGHNVHVDGSLDWRWVLTGHPYFFPDPPILMEDSGHFTFETFIPPGGNGYDVGWLVPPKGETFTSTAGPGQTSPLANLLSLKRNGVLRLWFGLDFTNVVGPAPWAMSGGPNTLYYQYAYIGPPLRVTDFDDIVVAHS